MPLVALDDGHGLETPGKRTPPFPDGTVILENQFNHAVKVKLMEALKRCGIDYVDCAPGHTDIPLAQRVKTANDAKADIYVSIHYNALDEKWDNNEGGLCVFHHTKSVQGKKLATLIHKYLRQGTKQKDRGVNPSGINPDVWYVMKHTNMPAALSESGFMDDRYEASLMLSTNFQTEVAEEHCQGICEYFGKPYIAPTQKVYRVQLGAFHEKATAEKLLAELKSKGYNDAIIV